KIARVANPLALVAQQQQVSHPQTHPTHFNQNSSTRTHQTATKKREKAVVNSPQPTYDQKPSMVDDDEDTECQKPKRAKDAAYHQEKMLLYVDDSGPIFDKEPEQKVQNDDHYDVFAIDCQHTEQSESAHNIYLLKQDAQNVSIESVDMNYDTEQIDQNDEDVDLAKERELLASLKRRNTIEYAMEIELECAK
nr:hypothetical protein [Tanacetum cinerariifolium]